MSYNKIRSIKIGWFLLFWFLWIFILFAFVNMIQNFRSFGSIRSFLQSLIFSLIFSLKIWFFFAFYVWFFLTSLFVRTSSLTSFFLMNWSVFTFDWALFFLLISRRLFFGLFVWPILTGLELFLEWFLILLVGNITFLSLTFFDWFFFLDWIWFLWRLFGSLMGGLDLFLIRFSGWSPLRLILFSYWLIFYRRFYWFLFRILNLFFWFFFINLVFVGLWLLGIGFLGLIASTIDSHCWLFLLLLWILNFRF